MHSRRFTLRQSLHVIAAIGWADFLLKYRGSVLGYFWSLLGPLAKFLVILYVFGPLVSPGIPLYPIYLFLGIILWEHFVNTSTGCMTMLEEKAPIIQKIVFPRSLLILMVGWTNLLVFLTHLFVFLIFAWVFAVPFTRALLYVPLLLIQMTLIALGIGMLLSSWCLKYRDIGHLWTIAVQILFWLTPITYRYGLDQPLARAFLGLFQRPLPHTPSGVIDIFVQFQPISILLHDAHRVLLYPSTLGVPSVTHAVVFTLICTAIFALGTYVFQKRSPYFPQEY